jgi:hypothetical protein
MKRIMIFLIVSFLMLSFTGPLFAKDESTADLSVPEVVLDVLWVRPIGLVQTALGAPFFVISLPVTIPLKKTGEAKEFLITYPFYYCFKRPLGEM